MPDIFGDDFSDDKPAAKKVAPRRAARRADAFDDDFASDLAPPKPQSPIGDRLAALWERMKRKAPGTITGQIVQSIGRGMALPGQVAQGEFTNAPAVPGQWSDEDEAIAQINQRNLVDRSANMAGLVMGGGVPAVTRQGPSQFLPFLNGGVSRPTAELAQTAIEKYGYPVRPGQMSDNTMVRRMDSMLERLPFSGYAKIGQQQREAINRGVTREIGEESPVFNSDVMAAAKKNRSAEYNKLFENEKAAPDIPFIGAVKNLLEKAADEVDAPSKVTPLNKAVRNILDKMDSDGNISGRAYQGLRVDGSTLRVLEKNQDPGVAYAARGIRRELDDLFRRSVSDENRDTLSRLDKQWAIMKSIEPLAVKAESNGGYANPVDIMRAISSGKAGRERVAYGNAGNMGELAAIGQAFKPMSTSGTAENTMMLQLLANPLSLGFSGGGLGAMIGGLPLAVGGGAIGAGATKGLGSYLSSPRRAANIIEETLMNGGRQAEAGLTGAPVVPLLEGWQGERPRVYIDTPR